MRKTEGQSTLNLVEPCYIICSIKMVRNTHAEKTWKLNFKYLDTTGDSRQQLSYSLQMIQFLRNKNYSTITPHQTSTKDKNFGLMFLLLLTETMLHFSNRTFHCLYLRPISQDKNHRVKLQAHILMKMTNQLKFVDIITTKPFRTMQHNIENHSALLASPDE